MADELQIKVRSIADDSKTAKEQLQRSIQSLVGKLEIPSIKILQFNIDDAAKQIKADLEKQLKDVKINATFQASSGSIPSSGDFEKQNSSLSQLEKKLQSLRIKIDTSQFDKQLVNLDAKLNELNVPEELQLGFDNVKNTLQTIKGEDFGKLIPQDQIALIKEFEVGLTKIINQTDILAKQQAFPNQEQQLKKLTNELLAYGRANSKLFSDAEIKKQFEDLIQSLNNGSISANQAKSKMLELKNSINEAGLASQSFGDKLQNAFARFGIYASLAAITAGVTQSLKQMTTEVVKIDDAMTELKKVTDLNEESYSRFLQTAQKGSAEIGATISDFIASSADFARLGYSLADAEQLAKAANVYKNVGDGIRDIDEATTSVISTLKGFGIEASQAMSIVDKFNEVGNKFAVSSSGIGEALRRSASALASTNNTLEESIGLIVAANTTVQDTSVVGTALKTLSMRLTNTAGELELLGEDAEGAAESITKLQTQLLNLTKGKVDIMLDPNTFKSTYDIIVELSEVWGELDDVSQASIQRLVGAQRQGNVFASMMMNMKDGIAAANAAMDAQGSALKENEKYLQSISGRVDLFRNSFQALSQTIIEGEFLKFFVDLGTTGLKAINEITVSLGGLRGILLVVLGLLLTIKTEATLGFLANIPRLLSVIITSIIATSTAISQLPLAMRIARAEGHGLSAALNLVGISATAAQLAIGALTLGLTIGLVAWNRYKQQQEEVKATSLAITESNKSQIQSLENVKKQLKDETLNREALIGIISKVNDEYENEVSQLESVNEVRAKSIELIEKEQKAKASDTVRTLFTQYEKASKYLEEEMYLTIRDMPFSTGVPKDVLEDVGNAIDNYQQKVKDGIELNSFTRYALKELEKVYISLKEEIEENEAVVNSYESALAITEGTYENIIDENENLIDSLSQTRQSFIGTIKDLSSQFSSLSDIDLSNLDETLKKIYSGVQLATSDVESLIEFKEALKDVENVNPLLLYEFGESIDEVNKSISESPDVVDAYSNANKNLISTFNQLSSAFAEQIEHGQLSIDTVYSLLDAGFAFAIQVDEETGAITLNSEAVLELTRAKLEMRIVDLELLKSELEDKLRVQSEAALLLTSALLGASSAKRILADAGLGDKTSEDINNINTQIELLKQSLGNIGSITAGEFSSSFKSAKKEIDKWLEAYKKAYAQLRHEREMDIINDQQYYDRLKQLDYDYFSSQENLKKYGDKYLEQRQKNEEELYKVITDIYKKKQQAAIDAIDKEIDALNKLKSSKDEEIEQEKEYLALLEKRKKDYDGVISAVIKLIDEEIKAINKRMSSKDKEIEQEKERLALLQQQKETYDKTISAVTSVIDEEIKKLNEEKDALKKSNDEQDRKLQLLKLEEDLAKAKENRAIRIYREDQGFVYEADTSEIEKAQKALEDFQIQEQVNAIDAQIDALNKYKQSWTDIADAFENEQQRIIAAQILGAEWEKAILEQRTDILSTFASDYYDLNASIENDVKERIRTLEAEKAELQRIGQEEIEILNGYKEMWTDVTNHFQDEQNKLLAAQILGANWEQDILNGRTEVLTTFQQKYFDLNEKIELDVKKRIETLEYEKKELAKNIDVQIENLQKLKEQWENTLDIEKDVKAYEIQLAGLTSSEKIEWNNRLAALDEFVKEWNKTVSKMKEPKSTGSSKSTGNYAIGTMSAPAGWATTNEAGNEIIIRNPSGLSTWLEDGDGVLPADLTRNIFNLARNPMQAIRDAIGEINFPFNQTKSQPILVQFGNIELPNVKDSMDFARTVKSTLINTITQISFPIGG